ncbi:ankyrin repeat-containing protein [Fusarium pseudoanthophilum]|uniref:Ankyrin repeat-containing protein n=1 Tax=Fusarium pseudoanthophilum TaxID=48495 RepID=A0A8H5L4N4_9HYPO|nr:ankyrin repeat-containing protein [Fusarium pseudoanthophilum]
MDEGHHTETALPMPIYTITHQCLLCFTRIEESNDKLFLQMIRSSETVPLPEDGNRSIKLDFPALRQNFLYWIGTTGALKLSPSLDEKLKGRDRISEKVLDRLNVILKNLNRITDKPHLDTTPSEYTQLDHWPMWKSVVLTIGSALDHLRQCAIEIAHFSAQQPIVMGKNGSFRRDIIALIRDRFPAARQALCRELGESIAKRRELLLQGAYPNLPLLASTSSVFKLSPPYDSIEYPPLPKVSEFETLVGLGLDTVPHKLPGVQCPFCYCELVLERPEDDILAIWRHHVDEHIQPYTCIFPACEEPTKYFMHREEWATHMVNFHDWLRKANAHTWWQCDTGHETPIIFEFRSQWRNHVRECHPELWGFASDQGRRERERHLPRNSLVCPLCDQIPEDAKRIMEAGQYLDYDEPMCVWDHIADHFKSLSMMVIPSIGDPACEAAKQSQKLAIEAKASRWTLGRAEESRSLPRAAPSVALDNLVEVTEIPTANGPDIALIERRGILTLCSAVELGLEAAVKLLVDSGARLEARDSTCDRTSLALASEIGHTRVVKILCMNGADPSAVSGEGRQTPLSLAAINGHEDTIRVLIDAGSDMEARTGFFNKAPLHWAVFKHRVECTRLLLQRGAQVNAKDTMIGTALCHSAGEGHLDIVKLLLEHGADTELTSGRGEAPLSLAAQRGHADVVRLLLAYGANIHAKNWNGETALDLAYGDEVIEVLKSH